MAVLRDPGPDVMQNSVFGIWKVPGKIIRLIWAGNRSNVLFGSEASGCDLPAPELVSSLRIRAGDELFLAGCDVSQNYNCLKVTEELIPLLGCPKVWSAPLRIEGGYRWGVPFVTVVPMEAYVDVQLAQRVDNAEVESETTSYPPPVTDLADIIDHSVSARDVVLAYID